MDKEKTVIESMTIIEKEKEIDEKMKIFESKKSKEKHQFLTRLDTPKR